MYGMRSSSSSTLLSLRGRGGGRGVLFFFFFHNVIRDHKAPVTLTVTDQEAASNLQLLRFFCKQSLSTSTDCTACSSKRRRRSRCSSVWSFGDGNHGALGLPCCNSSSLWGGHAYEPTRIQHHPDFPSSDVRSICAGHYHSMALTWAGHLWSWGRNHEGQLGRRPNSISTSRSEDWGRPRRVEGLEGVNAVAAFASGVVSMVVGEDGSLWTWGKSKRGQLGLGNGIIHSPFPMKVEALAGQNIVKVALGWGHALALTREGKVYGWGYSADGRLGDLMLDSSSSAPASVLGNNSAASLMDMAEKMVEEDIEKEKNMPIVWEPSLVPNVNGITVTDISCGLDHSLLLCGNGTLLSGGSNTYGQLGRDDHSGSPTMQPVELGYQPKCVTSGLGHSLALCPANKILSWGWNHNSQLGRGGDPGLPALVEGWDEEISSIRTISAGRAHSVAVTCEGEAFAWGCGRNGRLGLGSPTDEKEPRKVDYLEGMDVQEAVCGFDHTLVLVAE